MRKTLLFGLSLYCSVAAAETPHGFNGAWSAQGEQTATNNPADRFDPLPGRIDEQWVITGSDDSISICRRKLTDRNGMPLTSREVPCEPMEIQDVHYNGHELGFTVESDLEGEMYTEITKQYYIRLDSALRASGVAREIWDMAGNSLLPSQRIVTDYSLALTKMRERQDPLNAPIPQPGKAPIARQGGSDDGGQQEQLVQPRRH